MAASRGVLGGAKSMRQRPRWKEMRAQRIARQRAERETQEAEKEEEEEEDAPAKPARRGKKIKRVVPKLALKGVSFGLPAMNANRWTSVIIWLVGAFLTRSFLLQIGVAENMATPIGLVLQWLLTKAESPLWQGAGRPPIAIIATIIDGGMNTGGTWVYTKNIGNTDFWKMIQFAANDPALVPSVPTQIACAVGVGVLTAAAAEYYWNL